MKQPEQEPNHSEERLAFLLSALGDIGQVLVERDDFHDSAKYLLRLVLGTIGISRGAIYTCSADSRILTLEVSNLSPALSSNPVVLPIPAGQLFNSDLTPLNLNGDPPTFPDDVSSILENWRSLGITLLAPLAVREHFLAVMCLGSHFLHDSYTHEDVEMIRLLSCHISLFFYSRYLLRETRTANFNLNRKILELENLFELGLSITSLRTPHELENDVVTKAASILNARYGALIELSSETPLLRASFGFQAAQSATPLELRGIPFVDPDADRNARNPNHYLVAQLMIREHLRGYLIVINKENRCGGFDCFTDEDHALLSAFANQAAVGLDNAALLQQAIEKERLEKELDVASEIQRALLPAADPIVPGLDVAGRTIPCRTVGGDFFGYARMASGKFVITVADVSGKSVPAALLVSTYHAAFLALQDQFETLANAVEMLNQIIYRATPENRFITACLLCWNPMQETMDFVIAGHESPIIFKQDGQIDFISEGGLILGMFNGISYAHQTVRLHPGDIICLYSDGITDLVNPPGDRFERVRLMECVQNHRDLPAKEILENVFKTMRFFQGTASAPDDQTLIMIKHTGQSIA